MSHLKNVGINYDKLKVGCDQSDGRLLVMVGLGIFTTGEHTVISVISKVSKVNKARMYCSCERLVLQGFNALMENI